MSGKRIVNEASGNDSGKIQFGQIRPATAASAKAAKKAAERAAEQARKAATTPARVTNINNGSGDGNIQIGVVYGNVSR